jgi:hypothetical protein
VLATAAAGLARQQHPVAGDDIGCVGLAVARLVAHLEADLRVVERVGPLLRLGVVRAAEAGAVACAAVPLLRRDRHLAAVGTVVVLRERVAHDGAADGPEAVVRLAAVVPLAVAAVATLALAVAAVVGLGGGGHQCRGES